MYAEPSVCETRRMIFVASFEWVRASKITYYLCQLPRKDNYSSCY